MFAKLELTVHGSRFRPSETITGYIESSEPIKYRSLEVFLVLVERSRDFRHNNIYDSSGELSVKSIVDEEGKLNPGDQVKFKLTIPKLPWPAYSTEYGSLSWEVQARCDRFGLDISSSKPIEISWT